MTCMKQEFCIHEKYCQRHIGQNFDSCILFSRNSKPMTEQEYLQTCNTEQLADVFFEYRYAYSTPRQKLWMSASEKCIKTDIVEWLKQPHTP